MEDVATEHETRVKGEVVVAIREASHSGKVVSHRFERRAISAADVAYRLFVSVLQDGVGEHETSGRDSINWRADSLSPRRKSLMAEAMRVISFTSPTMRAVLYRPRRTIIASVFRIGLDSTVTARAVRRQRQER